MISSEEKSSTIFTASKETSEEVSATFTCGLLYILLAINPPRKINKDKIIDILGSVYEHSLWVPERLISSDTKVIKNNDELFMKMKSIVECASNKEKLKLLCAHPELGNKLKKLNNLTYFSKLEQKSAGLDQCSDEEFNSLTRLNKEYRIKFNFPFIIAVKDLTKENIIDEMKKRVEK